MFMSDKKSKNKYIILPFLLILSVLVLLFSSECSPLYPLNEWYDPNCFFTVGRAMLRGKVPYRDIYEQKGPYLYFLHALCALIDDKSFIGVWFMEIFLCFLLLLFVYKILRLYGIFDFKRVALISTLVALSVYFSFASSTGDSVEEICAPLLSGVVYFTLKRVKMSGGGVTFKVSDYFCVGVVSGFVFWSKFTIVGFFIGWYVFFLYHVFKNRQYKEIGISVMFILSGVVVATLPPLLYFSANHAVKDLLTVYLYDNLFLYREGGNFFLRFVMLFVYILGSLGANIQYNFFVILGIVRFAKRREPELREERMFLLLVPAIMTFFLFVGGRGYRYYGLPLHIFSVFGYIALAESDFTLFKKRVKRLLPAVMACFCVLFFFINGNYNYIFRPKEDTVQYKFAKAINEKENATLLNYGFLDGGFYLAADKTPESKYFCEFNIPLPEMREEKEKCVEEGLVDFIVVKTWWHSPEELDSENYEEVMRVKERYSLQSVTYILYALKPPASP